MIVVKAYREDAVQAAKKYGYDTPEDFILENFNNVIDFPRMKDLTEVFGCATSTMWRWKTELGIVSTRNESHPRHYRKDVVNSEVLEYLKTHKPDEVADMLNCSVDLIYLIRRGERRETPCK